MDWHIISSLNNRDFPPNMMSRVVITLLFVFLAASEITPLGRSRSLNSTCQRIHKSLMISTLEESWIVFVKSASTVVSRDSTNCLELWSNAYDLIQSIFNATTNHTTHEDGDGLHNISIGHNTTYSIDFFESLTVLVYTEATKRRKDDCVKARGRYDHDTGVCVKHGSTSQRTSTAKAMLFIIRIIGNTVSVLALVLLVTILFLCEELRTVPGRYMTHLSVVLLIGQTLYLLSPVGEKSGAACALLEISIHWAYLTVFSLMCMIAVSTTRTFCQPLLVSQQEKTRRYRLALKAAYGFPLVLTTPCLITHVISQGKINYGCSSGRFVSNLWANLLTFIVPIGLILIVNCACLIVAVYRIHKANTENKRILRKRKSYHKLRIQALVVMIKLGTFSGVGWIFGFLGSLTQVAVFIWAFEILCSFQGFGIFCGFACSVRVYRLFLRRLKFSTRTRPSLEKRYVDSKTTQM